MQQQTKFVELSGETNIAASRGAAVSGAYTNQPIMYGDEILDAAKNLLYFLDAVTIRMLPEGHKDYVEYKRTKYLGRTGVTFDSGEKGGSDITNTAMNNLTGVTITPTFYASRVTIENYSARVNVFNLVDKAREELIYAIADTVDRVISTGLGDATETTNTVAGAQTLYGGDATSDNTLAAGDVLTTDLIAEAARYLKGTDAWYWNSTTFTKSSGVKNGWMNTPETAFVLFVGPAQEMALRKDSQFVNASEYGSDEVVLNGEIGKYLGIKIVVTNNVESVAASGTAPDGGSVTGTAMTRCLLCVPKRAYTFVWGQAPEISVAALPWQASQTIVLETAYAGSVVHADAVVKIDVADA